MPGDEIFTLINPQARSCPVPSSRRIPNCFLTKFASHLFIWPGCQLNGVLLIAGEEPSGHPHPAHPLLHGRRGRPLPPHRHQVQPLTEFHLIQASVWSGLVSTYFSQYSHSVSNSVTWSNLSSTNLQWVLFHRTYICLS